jgi:putative colanic acid biosynthesis UDP-glucose lipid carrier transferase
MKFKYHKNSAYLFLLRLFMLAFDLIGLNLIIVLIYYRARSLFPPQSINEIYIFGIYNLSWAVLSIILKTYSKSFNFNFSLKRSIGTYFLHFVLNLAIIYIFLNNENPSIFYITYYYLAGFLFIPASRFISQYIINLLDKNFKLKKQVAILGNGPIFEKFKGHLESEESGCELVEINHTFNSSDIKSKLYQVIKVGRRLNLEDVYTTYIPESEAEYLELCKYAENNFIKLKFIPGKESKHQIYYNYNFEFGLPIISFSKSPLDNLENRIIKRFFDILLSSIVIVTILSWLWPIISLLIKIDSKGPVLFKQMRNGKNNKPFVCLKFRTMVPNRESNLNQATKNDHRFTKIGKILRKTNLDELPQFFNVLRGEMSIVGPRPHMLKHTKDYSSIIDSYMRRQYIKPGISGYAQVNGFRGNLDKNMMEKRVKYDIYYIQNWSPWFDLNIAIKTIKLTINGDKNAY